MLQRAVGRFFYFISFMTSNQSPKNQQPIIHFKKAVDLL